MRYMIFYPTMEMSAPALQGLRLGAGDAGDLVEEQGGAESGTRLPNLMDNPRMMGEILAAPVRKEREPS